jgi:acetyltransferase-like isoleucine patch superfamily enzyme
MRPITRDSLPHLTECAFAFLLSIIDTVLNKMRASWWQIALGKRCQFYGRTIFRSFPGSQIRIGDKCRFRSRLTSNQVGLNRPCMISTLNSDSSVSIGEECGFSGTVIAAYSKIIIGNRVICGANTTITDTDWHAISSRDRTLNVPANSAPVVIEDDVWLGLNVLVLRGVTIGAGTMVGAGSIVTQSLPAGVVAAGQPAKVLRTI